MADDIKFDFKDLIFPKDQWGWTDPDNEDLVKAFVDVDRIVQPKKIVEIGMFAGHSTLLMFKKFQHLEKIWSYDLSETSRLNAKQIQKHYNLVYNNRVIWNDEHKYALENIDLVFVDGNHIDPDPRHDIRSAIKIRPRYILIDNIEQPGVRIASKLDHKLWDIKYKPKYYFYTNQKYSSVTKRELLSPGIMGLFCMENY